MASRKNRSKKRSQEEEVIVETIEVQEQEASSSFIEENQNTIFGVLVAACVLIGAYMLYKQFVQAPQENAAIEQMAQSQFQFAQDSFALALTNPGGGYEGFADIASNYGSTPTGNTANLYSAISYLQLGQHDAAIEYLNDYGADGTLGPILKNGLLGDAYSQKNDLTQALSYYKKATSASPNDGLTPYYLLKQGMLELKNGNNGGAKAAFTTLKEKYPNSQFAQDAEKYLVRATAAM